MKRNAYIGMLTNDGNMDEANETIERCIMLDDELYERVHTSQRRWFEVKGKGTIEKYNEYRKKRNAMREEREYYEGYKMVCKIDPSVIKRIPELAFLAADEAFVELRDENGNVNRYVVQKRALASSEWEKKCAEKARVSVVNYGIPQMGAILEFMERDERLAKIKDAAKNLAEVKLVAEDDGSKEYKTFNNSLEALKRVNEYALFEMQCIVERSKEWTTDDNMIASHFKFDENDICTGFLKSQIFDDDDDDSMISRRKRRRMKDVELKEAVEVLCRNELDD